MRLLASRQEDRAPTKRRGNDLKYIEIFSLQTPELRGAMAVFALVMLETGAGDEVTLIGGVFLLALAMVLAWLSTHVAENGDHMIGAIISGGTPLVGLGDSEPYRRATPSSDPIEPQPTTHSQEDKPEDEDAGPGTAGGEDASLEDSIGLPGPTVSAIVDQHLDIQGLHKRTAVASAASETRPTSSCLSSGEDLHTEKGRMVTEEIGTICSPTTATDITVRLKFLNDTEELAVVRPEDTIGILTSKHFSGKERQIKLIYKGQLLRDPSQTLLSLNITHNSVVHCHISPNPPPEEEAVSEADPRPNEGALGLQAEPRVGPAAGAGSGVGTDGRLEMNVGSLVVPMFVLMLAVIWYFRINYRQLFTAPATISLLGVTIFFSFLVFGMYGR